MSFTKNEGNSFRILLKSLLKIKKKLLVFEIHSSTCKSLNLLNFHLWKTFKVLWYGRSKVSMLYNLCYCCTAAVSLFEVFLLVCKNLIFCYVKKIQKNTYKYTQQNRRQTWSYVPFNSNFCCILMEIVLARHTYVLQEYSWCTYH